MGLTQSIAKNTALQVIGKIIGTILGVITIGVLTRYLGQTGFGYYSTALAFMQFFGVLVDMGLYLICLKEISTAVAEKENYVLNNIFTLRIISAVIFFGGGALLIFLFPYPDAVKWAAAIVSVSFLFMSLVQILTSVFQKYLAVGLVALAEIIGRIGFLLLTLFFVFQKNNLPVLMLGNVLNSFIYFIILWFLVKKFAAIKFAFDFKYWRKIFKKTWPIALGIALNLVYFRADTIILSLYHPAADVGLYGAPYKILEIIATFPHMFMGLVMPILTAAWITADKERFKKSMQRTFDFLILLAIPMVLGSVPLADRIMRILAGNDFKEAGTVLPILMLATGFIFIGTLFTYTLVILEKQKPMLIFYFSAAVLSLAGYFAFIPKYSYFGAAWVTVAIEAFIALSAFLITYNLTKVKLNLANTGKTLTASLIMLAFTWLIRNWQIALIIPLDIIVFFALMFLLKGLDTEVIYWLKHKKNKNMVN